MARFSRVAALLILSALLLPIGVAQSAESPQPYVFVPAIMRALEPHCPPVRVFDYDGTERDWDWLVATFGAVWIEAGDGSACVIELRAKHDDATLIVRVEDPDGLPVGGIPGVFYWPDAPPLLPEHPELVGCYDRGVWGVTGYKAEGDPGEVGFGMGPGAFYCPPGGGPHTVWVGVPGSDCVHGLGMLCGTNHDHVNVTFMLAEKYRHAP